LYSYIIGQIHFDHNKLRKDLFQLEDIEFSSAYQEYAYGNWKICALWNQNGCQDQAVISEYNEPATKTAIGHKLEYISSIINEYFNVSCLKFARIFSASNNGLVIPHSDYLELNKPFKRIHIPIQTDLFSLTSEEDKVFHMRLGEVWYLDASKVHSAACFSKINRLHLVLDFDTDFSVEKILLKPDHDKVNIIPKLIEREKLSDDFIQKLLSLSNIICKENFRDIVAILAKVHFKKSVNASSMFDWLKIITEKTKDPFLIEQAYSLHKKCIISR